MGRMKDVLIELEERGCHPCPQGLECYLAGFTLPCSKKQDGEDQVNPNE